jgi:two-component system, chemotaxis family, protein-glutamate methylesterase/glutaminase
VEADRIGGHTGGRRDLVVVGASAGGVAVLMRLVKDLPTDLRAAVCVVLHIAPGSPSMLAHILGRATKLSCHTARDGEALREGVVLVAPPDHHLVIEDGHARLTAGPRENGHRPAIDVLFRSAARALDSRVVGVVLSGTRDDGTAGLAAIKSRGGGAIVQDPADAMYAGMPASAIAGVSVDAVVPAALLGSTIAEMVNGEDPPPWARRDERRLTGAVQVNPGGQEGEQSEEGAA